MKRFSLRARLTWILALIILVVLGSAARIVDLRADADMRHRFDAALLARAQSLAMLVRAHELDINASDLVTSSGVFPGTTGRKWYRVECGGAVVASTPVGPPRLPMRTDPNFGSASLADGVPLRMVAFRFASSTRDPHTGSGDPTCKLWYALDAEPLTEILRSLDYILLGTLLAACALVLLLTPWAVVRSLRPLSVLDEAMAGIGPDTPGERLPATGLLIPHITHPALRGDT